MVPHARVRSKSWGCVPLLLRDPRLRRGGGIFFERNAYGDHASRRRSCAALRGGGHRCAGALPLKSADPRGGPDGPPFLVASAGTHSSPPISRRQTLIIDLARFVGFGGRRLARRRTSCSAFSGVYRPAGCLPPMQQMTPPSRWDL
jgi:hypothetical protein